MFVRSIAIARPLARRVATSQGNHTIITVFEFGFVLSARGGGGGRGAPVDELVQWWRILLVAVQLAKEDYIHINRRMKCFARMSAYIHILIQICGQFSD